METPIDIAVKRSRRVADAARRKGAKKKNVKEPSLRVKVLSLVRQANRSVPEARRVVPRDALIVLSRALEELSALPQDSREFAALREVNRFISLNQNTHPKKEQIKHTDLLAAGHPLSNHNAYISGEDFIRRYAEWLSADPSISTDARRLVYTAFSSPLGSLERKHAFTRLRSLQASAVPAYFKFDHALTPLVAAFRDGNSSAARRARVALQWRDRYGKWVEMGRGLNIKVRLANGNVVNVPGVHVGVDPSNIRGTPGQEESDEGLVQVIGNEYVPDGIFRVPSGAAEQVQARISDEALRKAGITPRSYVRQARFGEKVVGVDELVKGRLDAPVGWEVRPNGEVFLDDGKQLLPDGSTIEPVEIAKVFKSDDDYVATQSADNTYALYRTDQDGKLVKKVGEGSDWAQISELAKNDEKDYDRYKEEQAAGELPLEGVEPSPRAVGDIEEAFRLREDRRRAQEREFENRRVRLLEEDLAQGRDAALRTVPDSWEGVLDARRMFPEVMWNKKLIGDAREGDRVVANVLRDGKINVGTPAQWFGRDLSSWEEADLAAERALQDINENRERAGLLPLSLVEDTKRMERTGGRRGDPQGREKIGYNPYLDEQARKKSGERPLQLHAQMVKDSLEKDKRPVSDGRAEMIRDMIDREGLLDWSEATEKEIKDAIKEALEIEKNQPYLDDRLVGLFDETSRGLSDKYHTLFKDAEGTPISKLISNKNPYEISTEEGATTTVTWGPDVPKNAVAVASSSGESGDLFVLRYPDNTYHIANLQDRDKYNSESEYVVVEPVDAWDTGILEEIADPNSMFWAFGETFPKSFQEKLEDRFNAGEFESLIDGDGPQPPSGEEPPALPPSGDTPGGTFADYVEDLSRAEADLAKDLEENLDGDAAEVGTEFVDKMYEDASSRFDLAIDIADNKPDDMSNEQFVDEAVARMREILSDLVDSAIEERRNLEDDDDLEVDFDKDAFVDAGAEKFRELLQNEIDNMEDGDGPDEPPTPPDGGGGLPPKAPSPSEPSSPALFEDFDAPTGAFRLNTVDYEPVGREDQESPDYTDNPERLAVRFSLDALVRALSQAMIGDVDSDVLNDILDANVDDDGDVVDLEEINDIVNVPPSRASRARGTGAGQLEFRNGEEFVPAEALYNAVFRAGGDPNRVIANAYDAVHGDRRNLEKLTQAAGELPSGDDQDILDEMTDEIRQLKDEREDGESSIANKLGGDTEESSIVGELIYNVPVNFEDLRIFTPDPNPYIPQIEDVDSDGYTDNPKLLAEAFAQADLLDQLSQGILDRSGFGYFNFSDPDDNEVAYEVPVEAVRDALQYQGVNTNVFIEAIAKEELRRLETELQRETAGEEFEDGAPAAAPTPEPEPEPSPETTREESRTPSQVFFPTRTRNAEMAEKLNRAAEEMREYISTYTGIASEQDYAATVVPIAVYETDSSNAMLAVALGNDQDAPVWLFRSNGTSESAPVRANWFSSPVGGQGIGWQPMSAGESAALLDYTNPFRDRPETPSESLTPVPQYPGPREPGYSSNNTTLDSGRNVIAFGYKVVHIETGEQGVVAAIQNDPEYVRIRFENGKTKVKSARLLRVIATKSGETPQPREEGEVNVQRRLEAEIAPAPSLARSGETRGVNISTLMPQELAEYANPPMSQKDFSVWGLRDAEIAKAANDRPSLEKMIDALADIHRRRLMGELSVDEYEREKTETLRPLIGDVFGIRDGVSFGSGRYKISFNETSYGNGTKIYVYDDRRDPDSKEGMYSINIEFNIDNADGDRIGSGSRTISVRRNVDANGNLVSSTEVSNNVLRLSSGEQKKGFASAFNRYMDNWYIANGVSAVRVQAAAGGDWVGGLVWALTGFNFDTVRSARDMAETLVRAARTDREKTIAEDILLRAKVASRANDLSMAPSALEMALAGWTPGSKQDEWLGARVLKRTPWAGIKHLVPDAKEQTQLVNYAQIKNAEVRVKSGQNRPGLSASSLSYIASNEFQESVAPYMTNLDEIRPVLRNNDSLASLSPEGKSELQKFVKNETLNKDSKMPVEDLARLREALFNEYQADYGYASDSQFIVGDILRMVPLDDFQNESSMITAAGFSIRRLDVDESGANATWLLRHADSGQRFFVKYDEVGSDYQIDVYGAEVDSASVMRAAGLAGAYDVRESEQDGDTIIMSEVGSSLPLAAPVVQGMTAMVDGVVTDPNNPNSVFMPSSKEDFIANMVDPTDVVRLLISDAVGSYVDRHSSNWMAGYDTVAKGLRVFPVDNTFFDFSETVNTFVNVEIDDHPLYGPAINFFLSKMGSDRAVEMLQAEGRRMIRNINDPIYAPTGANLRSIEGRYGTLDTFTRFIEDRINEVISDGDLLDYFRQGVR